MRPHLSHFLLCPTSQAKLLCSIEVLITVKAVSPSSRTVLPSIVRPRRDIDQDNYYYYSDYWCCCSVMLALFLPTFLVVWSELGLVFALIYTMVESIARDAGENASSISPTVWIALLACGSVAFVAIALIARVWWPRSRDDGDMDASDEQLPLTASHGGFNSSWNHQDCIAPVAFRRRAFQDAVSGRVCMHYRDTVLRGGKLRRYRVVYYSSCPVCFGRDSSSRCVRLLK